LSNNREPKDIFRMQERVVDISNRHYQILVEQGEKAPCNGCEYEEHCKKGYACERYTQWVSYPNADLSKFERVPDRRI
jgi:hypothetical protein